MMESQPGVLWNLSIALNALKLSIHWRLPLRLSGKKKTTQRTSAAMKQMISQASFGLLWGPLFKISRPNNTVNPVAQWHLIHTMYKRI